MPASWTTPTGGKVTALPGNDLPIVATGEAAHASGIPGIPGIPGGSRLARHVGRPAIWRPAHRHVPSPSGRVTRPPRWAKPSAPRPSSPLRPTDHGHEPSLMGVSSVSEGWGGSGGTSLQLSGFFGE
ncbi:hypothetical protein ACOJVU_08140 [Mycobacterium sp. THU-M104]|uniref:hypothetical protein n=1 Tax=Mycobacterium sp. THU-M104 TaxID=3410515 RepID=UPI003B9C2493